MSADSPVIVEALHLKKIFYDFWKRPKAAAVNGIDFEVRQGEVIGFLGPNGSGKSTTVKMILGLLNPTSGSLNVFGKAPSHVQTKTNIGYLPEETYLYKYLTAAETLDFFGSLFKLSPEQRKVRTRELLDMVGMQSAANRPVGEFSKGMARRIGLAQALINDPALLILDEPTSGLDPLGCREIKDIIKTLAARGKTVILCSHLLSDVQDVCDRVLIMYGGKIRVQETIEELLNVDEKTRITTPKLKPEILKRVLEILDESHPNLTEVDHPQMNLEEIFIEVVNKARQESVETAGAAGGGEIASFLAEGDSESKEALLKSLTEDKDKEAEAAQAAEAEKESAAASEADKVEVSPEHQRELEKLTKLEEAPPAEADEQSEASEEKKKSSVLSEEEKSKKNKDISDILNKKK